MISLSDAKTFVDLLMKGVDLIDKLYPKLHLIFTGEQDDRNHSAKIDKTETGLKADFRYGPPSSVTYKELMERISDDDLSTLRALEGRISNQLSVVQLSYAELHLKTGDEKARETVIMQKRIADVSDEIDSIFNYLHQAGLNLDDHYERAQFWIHKIKTKAT